MVTYLVVSEISGGVQSPLAFKSGSHVVRYSSYEWSGVWSDLSIEQTLMKAAKSEGGISSGRFRNGESAYRLWVQTLSHWQ